MNWVKILTQGGGWVSIAAAVITLVLKQCGIEVEESAVLALLVAGFGAQAGAKFIPVKPSGVPIMSDLHNKTIDAIYHLDGVLTSEAASKAIAVLWNEARTVKRGGE